MGLYNWLVSSSVGETRVYIVEHHPANSRFYCVYQRVPIEHIVGNQAMYKYLVAKLVLLYTRYLYRGTVDLVLL